MWCTYLFKLVFLFSPDIYPAVVLLDHMAVLSLVFPIVFSIMAASIWQVWGNGQGGLACCGPWGHEESDTIELLNWTELNWTEVMPHCGFDLHFSDDYWYRAFFQLPAGCLYVFFGKMSVQVFCLLFNWFAFLNIELYELFIYFGCLLHTGHIIWKYFLPFIDCLFILLITFAVHKFLV